MLRLDSLRGRLRAMIEDLAEPGRGEPEELLSAPVRATVS